MERWPTSNGIVAHMKRNDGPHPTESKILPLGKTETE
jgi:hypothetical protein